MQPSILLHRSRRRRRRQARIPTFLPPFEAPQARTLAMATQRIQDPRDFVFVTSPQAVKANYAPYFYTSATFRITEPEHGLAFIRAMRPDNLVHLRKLSIVVDAFYVTVSESEPEKTRLRLWHPEPNAPAWHTLLEAVRDRLPGLRELDLYLHAELTGYHQDWPKMGPGVDVEFARRLAALKGLERLTLDGFFAREWPLHLERKLGLGLGHDGGQERGESVWSARGKKGAYLALLERYQGYCQPCVF